VFGARIFDKIFATASEAAVGPLAASIYVYICAHASSFVRQSQIPSHAKIMNLSSLVLGISFISGLQVTAYFSGAIYD